jgi:hypothetical protein
VHPHLCLPLVASVAAAGLVAGAPVASSATPAYTSAFTLTGNGTSLGDGIAYIMGGTGMPQPSERFLDAVDELYLQPHGFGGELFSLWTPENVSSTSQAVGGQILYNAVMGQINGGEVDADNPVVVFGYSQSASISVRLMERLADEGVSDDLVRFVLIGSPGTSGVPTDLYRTDVYNYEYDPVAFRPTYFNPLADINAALGFLYGHSVLLSATPEQVASAIELPTSDPDSLASFYMIPSELLPILAPLQLIPILGQPLYELLEPVTRILVNLGYGNIENGWPPGAVDGPGGSGLFPNVDLGELLSALGNGVQSGITNAIDTLLDPENYQIIPLIEHPSLAAIIQEGYIVGAIDSPTPTLSEALTGLVEFFQGFTDTTEYPMPD